MADITVVEFLPNTKNELHFTNPTTDALVSKNRQNAWIQLAGHEGLITPAGPQTVRKMIEKCRSETKAYEGLMNDRCRDLVPKFYREVEYNGDFFIEIENLMQHFQHPSMMDVKMGYRTFEAEQDKNDPTLRRDSYERMMLLNPMMVTEHEQKVKGVTKQRYKQFCDQESSTSELGFRLEAIKVSGEQRLKTCLRSVKHQDEVLTFIRIFLNCNKEIHRKFLSRLRYIREVFASSEFFKHHEVLSSSLLFLYDEAGSAGIWMIDFAKTTYIGTQTLHHISRWEMGNYEDGYLAGMDNLINIFEELDH